MPSQARPGTSWPKARAISATQTGWMQTSAVAEATEV